MDPKSGAIATFETELDAKLAGYTVPLSKEQFSHMQGMNRKQRRAHLAQERRAKKKR
jgi:hypothetical protein